MRKLIVLTAILVLAAGNVYAAGATSGTIDFTATGLGLYGGPTSASTADGATPTSIGRASTGVAVAWQTDTSGYALMTQHEDGTKAYGTSYDSTALYQTTGSVDPGTAAFGSGALSASDTTDFKKTGWSSM